MAHVAGWTYEPADDVYLNSEEGARICEHPVGRFLLPLLAAHEHKNVEVFCYGDVRNPDPTTARLRAHADVWRDTAGVGDGQLAGTIRDDRIDILVDLTMHMASNRLPLFARKPAPVQVTYLAYASTTGLDTIDYRLTDPFLDPPGSDDRDYSERSVRLPETYWCYQPGIVTPEVSPAPALHCGQTNETSQSRRPPDHFHCPRLRPDLF